jgi:hypothetical protein
MQQNIIPTKQGQIVKSFTNLNDFDATESFILADDPRYINLDDFVLVYSVTEFLRSNIKGQIPKGCYVKLKYLTVISDDLKTWVESWNE